ncbi:MAG: choice-of-anchor L domain-containing protein [Bacteroidia bacterium]|nr:choice-of-anchor L domain-containing protein [Bacteroidia bacterium]
MKKRVFFCINKKTKKGIVFLFFLFFFFDSNAQLVIDSTKSVTTLIQNMFVGSGVTVFNVTHSGPPNSIAAFGGTTNLGVSSGILMSTGSVSVAYGPNFSGSSTVGATGIVSLDTDLTSIASGTLYDANILEFDFIAISDTVIFNYVFASEEYPEYVLSGFNDVFGFFVSGINPSGGNYIAQNFALVPGTSSPVSINTINASVNSAYFFDNITPPGSTIQYDGFTTPLIAKFAVQCGTVYHIKIAITDVFDSTWDSGLFFEEFSFASIGTPAPLVSGIVSNSLGPITDGSVVIFSNGSYDSKFDTVKVAPIDVNGYYEFISIPPGNYIVKAFPNKLIYPNAITTYYGDDFVWDTALIIGQTCGISYVYDITIIEGEVLVGPGGLSGKITEGNNFTRLEGDPIPGIDVKLGRNPGGQIISSTQTDASGNYTFLNVPYNDGAVNGISYTVYVDMPGLGRDSSYVIVLNSSSPNADSLNYLADSTTIYVNSNPQTVISNYSLAKQNKFNVYPNPFKENITVSYSLNANAEVKLEVYNVLGEKVQSIVNTNQQAGEYNYNTINNLNSGVYFVSLSVNGKISTQRIIKMD